MRIAHLPQLPPSDPTKPTPPAAHCRLVACLSTQPSNPPLGLHGSHATRLLPSSLHPAQLAIDTPCHPASLVGVVWLAQLCIRKATQEGHSPAGCRRALHSLPERRSCVAAEDQTVGVLASLQRAEGAEAEGLRCDKAVEASLRQAARRHWGRRRLLCMLRAERHSPAEYLRFCRSQTSRCILRITPGDHQPLRRRLSRRDFPSPAPAPPCPPQPCAPLLSQRWWVSHSAVAPLLASLSAHCPPALPVCARCLSALRRNLSM